ncbi:MAG: prepilin-type N-terminal cleavage/methylation domain-containing protein [Acidobacteria bacterium]|nr:MAG: prepilin-type N-terminal cleavage/methylation domain-containing protein [Acidobacteriota bacterium]
MIETSRAKRSSRTPDSSRGFSVVELLVVIGVLGIAAVIGAIALQAWLPRAGLDGAVNATDVMLKRMKLLAVRRQIGIEVILEDATATKRPVADMLANPAQPFFLVARIAGEPDKTLSLLTRVALPTSPPPGAGILLREISFPDERIVFTRLGGVENPGTLTFGYYSGETTLVARQIRIENVTGKMSKVATTLTVPSL